MEYVAKALVGLSALAFLLAVIIAVTESRMMGISAEGMSRACSNMALIGIAMMMMGKRS